MIFVGIDVAKDKHDCCILGPDTEELFPVFTIRNNSDGYGELWFYNKCWGQHRIGADFSIIFLQNKSI